MPEHRSRGEVFAEGCLPSSWFSVDRSGDTVFRSEITEWSVVYQHRWSRPADASTDPVVEPPLDGVAGLAAVKVVDLNFKRVPHDARKEARLLAKLSHPNVVRLLTALYSYPSLHIHMPLYETRLSDVLDSDAFVPSHPGFALVAKSLLLQLARALSFLHARSIAHRDVAVNNVVLSTAGRLVLVDFGTAWDPAQTGSESADHLEFELGTMPYRAPELVFGSRHYSPAAIDLWALGAVAASFFTELEPLDRPPQPALPSQARPSGSTAADWYSAPPQTDSYLFDPEGEDESWSLPGLSVPAVSQKKRKTLFVGQYGDFALAGSIFKVIGTPTLDTWPEARRSPDFSRFEFHAFAAQPLSQVLPNLPETPDERALVVDLIGRLLVYPSDSRLPAAEAERHPYFADALEPGAQTVEGKTIGEWLRACTQPHLHGIIKQ